MCRVNWSQRKVCLGNEQKERERLSVKSKGDTTL